MTALVSVVSESFHSPVNIKSFHVISFNGQRFNQMWTLLLINLFFLSINKFLKMDDCLKT